MESTKLALWRNDKREKDTQPYFKGGKPQMINGQEVWVSAWFNLPKEVDEATKEKIYKMLGWNADQLGTFPMITVSIEPVEQNASFAPPAAGASGGDGFGDEIPFAPVRGLIL